MSERMVEPSNKKNRLVKASFYSEYRAIIMYIYYILYTYKRPGNGALSSGTEFMTNMGSEAFEWTLFYLWTGETRKRAGVGRQRYGRRERKLREAGGSDLHVPPPPPHNIHANQCLFA